jgi:hypothetical protein
VDRRLHDGGGDPDSEPYPHRVNSPSVVATAW